MTQSGHKDVLSAALGLRLCRLNLIHSSTPLYFPLTLPSLPPCFPTISFVSSPSSFSMIPPNYRSSVEGWRMPPSRAAPAKLRNHYSSLQLNCHSHRCKIIVLNDIVINLNMHKDNSEENLCKAKSIALAKGKHAVLIYQLSVCPCPIYFQKGKFGDTPMIGHKLIGKARDLHYAYFGAGRNYGLHCLLCKVCKEFEENKECKVCKECIQKNGSLAWVNFRSKLPHTLVGYSKIMGRAPLHLISFPIWQKIYVPGFILEGIRLLNIYLWRRSPKCQFKDLIRHSLLVFDLQ